MKAHSVVLGLVFAFAAPVWGQLAQTITTIDALGETIVEVVTTDVLGLATTQTLQTLTGTSTSSQTTATTTTPDIQQGPVGMPPTVTPVAGNTVYTYTTTDANGDTIAVADTFTPTFAATKTPAVTTTGTILDYSEWLSMVGTNTPSLVASNSAQPRWDVLHGILGTAMAALGGVAGGACLVLL
ncbi:hypothetical protein K474DRAFT_1661888 [Panus rudis PR-1116 ss-1]|nr:hypothetical protein K474DRAFT_1661888 [Panus rudis PR-1116 ss-1]